MHHIGTKRLDRYHELGQVGTQQGDSAEALQQPSSRALHCRYVRWTCLTCPRLMTYPLLCTLCRALR